MTNLGDISPLYWTLALAGAFCLGVSKTGFPGLAIVNVLIIAELFGGKTSVGIVLPLLVVCDLIVFPQFRQYATWKDIVPLVLPALAGILAGYFLLDLISDLTAKRVIGAIILVMLILQLIRASRETFLAHLPDSPGFRWVSGLTIGVSTMMANAAGPVYSIYALVHRMTKNEFVGIGARFFLLMNVIKVPFLVNLDLINASSLKIDLCLLPGIALGILAGKKLLRLVPQKIFEWLLYAFSALAAGKLLLT